MVQNAASDVSALPPIVLMVDDDADTVDEYSALFEASGLWVATASQPSEAMDTVDDLRPNLVVTDLESDSVPAAEFVHTLKSSPVTRDIPVIVLSPDAPATDRAADVRHEADVFLTKPVPAPVVLAHARELIETTRVLRERMSVAQEQTAQLRARSRALRATTAAVSETLARKRCCPGCGAHLEWVERGRIGGTTYDYYRWCLKGCGLYCYERESQRWVKLA